jgi:hypothetical protein
MLHRLLEVGVPNYTYFLWKWKGVAALDTEGAPLYMYAKWIYLFPPSRLNAAFVLYDMDFYDLYQISTAKLRNKANFR